MTILGTYAWAFHHYVNLRTGVSLLIVFVVIPTLVHFPAIYRRPRGRARTNRSS